MIIAVSSGKSSDLDRLLEGTGIAPQMLKDVDAGITVEGYKQLLINAKTVSGNDTIMLEAGAKLPITAHGPLGYAAAVSPDRRSTLILLEKFMRLRGYFATLYTKTVGRKSELIIKIDDSLGDEKNSALDFILTVFMNSLFMIGLTPLSFIEIRLSRPKPAAHLRYTELLACSVSYNHTYNSIVFNTSDLDLPLPCSDPPEFEAAVKKCQILLFGSLKPATACEAVNNVFQLNPGLIWPITNVAAHLCISARTLQRKLTQEQTNYQTILDLWLQDLAVQYLQKEGLTIEVTASLLGYNDEANFRRAFKRWFTCSPSVYLNRQSLSKQAC